MKPTLASLSKEGNWLVWYRGSSSNSQTLSGARIRYWSLLFSFQRCMFPWLLLLAHLVLSFLFGALAFLPLACIWLLLSPALYHLQLTMTKLWSWTLTSMFLNKRIPGFFSYTLIHSKYISLGLVSAYSQVSCDSGGKSMSHGRLPYLTGLCKHSLCKGSLKFLWQRLWDGE